MKQFPQQLLSNWLDSRTGWRHIVQGALYEHIPGGARWRYVWGSTLVFTFVVQVITGFFLWTAYSPSSQTAWESVYYIQYEMAGGWLLRGIHHYAAQLMVVLLALHLMQVVIDGSYRAPREFNFWIGLILLHIVLGLALTGYLLPWDQKGYWATKVSTNIMGLVPLVGDDLQRLVVGGPEYGHHTLTRFFAVHAGMLPFLMMAFLVIHLYFFRRRGIRYKEPKRNRDCYFWPDQVLKDTIACLAVVATILFLVLRHRLWEGSDGHLGAPLMAPAEPSEQFSAARPEWYFLSLYQFLKYFPGKHEVWGAIYIPGLLVTIIALMPFIGRWKLGHRFNVVFLFSVLTGAVLLTLLALSEDASKEDYARAIAEAERNAVRVRELAQGPQGIPTSGAITLLRSDPLTQGPKLFSQYCASCHRYDNHDGRGQTPEEEPTAADLKGFGSEEWLIGFFDPDQIDQRSFFGGSAQKEGKMVDFVKKTVARYDDEKRGKLSKVIRALAAEGMHRTSSRQGDVEYEEIMAGRLLMQKKVGDQRGLNCVRCHKYHDEGELGKAPDLSGYGSREWIVGMISNPEHERFYSETNDRMPSFGEKHILDEASIGLIVDWLLDESAVASRESARRGAGL